MKMMRILVTETVLYEAPIHVKGKLKVNEHHHVSNVG